MVRIMDNTIYIDLPLFDVESIDSNTDESEIDNHYLGEYQHIRIFTIPHGYKELNEKHKVACKGINIPYKDTWQELTEAFPVGRVIKIKDCFYEVTTISLEVTGKQVLEGTWLTTEDFNAKIQVKSYGTDSNSDNEIIINLGVMG